MTKISVYIIAYNEEDKIGPALKSVQWADEIVVADSYSSDRTAIIAQDHGAKVIQVRFSGFGDLRNKAIAACSHDWIFSLDADERCTRKARKEIEAIIVSDNPLDAYYIPRKNYFMGKWIRYAGFYPDYRQPQLFRKGILEFQPDAVHERYSIAGNKKPGYFKSHIIQIPYKNLEEILNKANRYSSLGADKLFLTPKKAWMINALTHGIWSFLSLYVFKLGFLDGWPGFIIALGNFEGTFYKYAKFYLKKNGLDDFFDYTSPEDSPD